MDEYNILLRNDVDGWGEFEMVCQAHSFGEAEQLALRVYDDLSCIILSITRELNNG